MGKHQKQHCADNAKAKRDGETPAHGMHGHWRSTCLLYTSDAADERSSVDLGGRRLLKKKTD